MPTPSTRLHARGACLNLKGQGERLRRVTSHGVEGCRSFDFGSRQAGGQEGKGREDEGGEGGVWRMRVEEKGDRGAEVGGVRLPAYPRSFPGPVPPRRFGACAWHAEPPPREK